MARIIFGLGLIASLLLAGCGADGPGTMEETGSSAAPLEVAPGSLVFEAEETIADVNGSALGTLEAIDETRNERRAQYVLALHNPAGNKLRVQLRSLRDDLGLGQSLVVADQTFTGSTIRRVRVVPFGANNFVVATRQGNHLILRSFAVLDGQDDATAQLVLQATLDTGEVVSEMEATRVFQADPALFQLATLVQQGSSESLITWQVDAATGEFTRQATSSRTNAEGVTRMSIAGVERPFGLLVSAEAFPSSTLLTPWTVSDQGAITRKTARTEATIASAISVVRSGYASVSVVRNPTSASVAEISAYDVDTSSNIELRQTTSFGNSSNDPHSAIAVHSTGSRVFVAGNTASGPWTVRSWTNFANQRQMDARFGSSGTYDMSSGTVVRADRLVVAALNATGGLQLLTLHDYNTPLIAADFGSVSTHDDVLGNTTNTFSFNAGFGTSPESLIAASPRFVMTCSTGSCFYFDKAGVPLPDNSGNSLTSIFAPLMPTFLKHLHIQYPCDALADNSTCPSKEKYDTKLFYSATVNRFIVVTSMRQAGSIKMSEYTGIAVSHTEDPRDGFYVYATTDSMVRDNLSASAGGGMLIVTHGGGSDSLSRPSAWLFDLRDLASGAAFVRNSKILATQTNDSTGALLAPLQYSDDPENSKVGFIVGRAGQPTQRHIFEFSRPLGGRVNVTEYVSSQNQYSSGNNTEIDTIEVFEHIANDGTIAARWWDTGSTNESGSSHTGTVKTHLAMQSVLLAVSPTTGIISGRTDVYPSIPCPQDGATGGVTFTCSRPNVTAKNGTLLFTYLRVDSNNRWNFAGTYLANINATPQFVPIRSASGSGSFPGNVQTANVVPDPASPWLGDFWGIQVVSQSDGSFTTKGGRVFQP